MAGSEDNISSRSVKCYCMRLLFIDEIEACGCNIINDIEGFISKCRKTIQLFFRVTTASGAWGNRRASVRGIVTITAYRTDSDHE